MTGCQISTIEKIEAIPFSMPLKRATKWARGANKANDHVLVRVYSSSGAVGTTEAVPRPTIYGETQVSIVHMIEKFLAPMLVGSDPHDRVGYWSKFDTYQWNPTAKGALDIAIHDLLAQEAGLPLAKFLGGADPDPLRISYMLPLSSPETCVKEATEIKEQFGINAFKVKAGLDPANDLERVRRLREALGSDCFLFIDANQGYTIDVAIRTLEQMLTYNIAMVEEPLRVDMSRQRKRLADAVPIPILTDDSVITLADVKRELELGAAGVIGIKPPRTGIYNSLRILHAAEVFGLPCWIGSQGVSDIGTMASAHFYAAAARQTIPFPADLGNYLAQVDHLLETPVVLRDGCIHLSNQPGVDAAVSDEKLRRFRIDR
ncbi:mandelate racemase/muconate lactonizing enzyme family protein [Sinorhizobium medicae]|uniref:mandelate racemase/muconate lactonizing enzyme family protein n=1 Tax=Sinorhizobium medicae TaxID=110321 RepID=UPI0013E2D8C2|nr:enolase C-terminal domain-like protein [Sinorhizobium medicae]